MAGWMAGHRAHTGTLMMKRHHFHATPNTDPRHLSCTPALHTTVTQPAQHSRRTATQKDDACTEYCYATALHTLVQARSHPPAGRRWASRRTAGGTAPSCTRPRAPAAAPAPPRGRPSQRAPPASWSEPPRPPPAAACSWSVRVVRQMRVHVSWAHVDACLVLLLLRALAGPQL